MNSTADFHIYLASASPRRLQLLSQLGIQCQQLSADIDESVHTNESPENYVARLATEKAQAIYSQLKKEATHSIKPILAADTSVVLAGEIFGKPTCKENAQEMLRALSGKTHQVMTGVAVVYEDVKGNPKTTIQIQISEVRFSLLNEHLINAYIATEEPFGKAGAYAIQGKASSFIKHMSGSYSGVMGLPLYETKELLAEAGIDVWDN